MPSEKTLAEVRALNSVATLLTHARMGTQVDGACAEAAIKEIVDHFEAPKSAQPPKAPKVDAPPPAKPAAAAPPSPVPPAPNLQAPFSPGG